MRIMYEPVAHVVLYQPEIPHNTGSVGRTCVAIGAKLWLVRPLGFRLDDYYLRRAGLDYWQHLVWEVVDDWQALVAKLPRQPWLFTKRASLQHTDLAYQRGDVFVFGCESAGLPASILDAYPQRHVRIPMRPEARSLNLSNSVAIALYEAKRQNAW
jgi:tRNA (cytidine/uridine-2'-O-)-methyltransferase